MAQFRELEAFAQFASDLDEATRKQLERGQRITEIFKQKQYCPLSVAKMALSLFAAQKGYLDDITLDKIAAFEAALHYFVEEKYQSMLDLINQTGDFSEEIENKLEHVLTEFKQTQSW